MAVRIDDGPPFLLWLGAAPLDAGGLKQAVDQALANHDVVAMLSVVHGREILLPLRRRSYVAATHREGHADRPRSYDWRANLRWIVRQGDRVRAEIEAGCFHALRLM